MATSTYTETFKPWHLKYRPQKIKHLTGQEMVQQVLTRLIGEDSVPQALLLSGPKGTGKTSTARIIAMSLNCDKGVTLNPCGKCQNCQSIQSGNSLDIVELDAASNNGVDEIRKLVSDAAYAPISGRYRVFIIDEAHQLTTAAQNAFLKTLEEPNNNTKFLLATTEPHKLLDTVKSRCLPLRFRPISEADIVTKLREVADNENLSVCKGVLPALARSSKGGMRDAIQLIFEVSCSCSNQESLTVGKVYEVTKELNPTQVERILTAVIDGNSYHLVHYCRKMQDLGIVPEKGFDTLLCVWTDLMAVVLGASTSKIAKSSVLSESALKDLSERVELEWLDAGLNKLEQVEKRITTSPHANRWLLATLLSLASTGE